MDVEDFPQADALDVLAQAIEDPDRLVRYKAIAALRVLGTPQAIAVLRQAACGTTQPRPDPAGADDGRARPRTPEEIGRLRSNERRAAAEALREVLP